MCVTTESDRDAGSEKYDAGMLYLRFLAVVLLLLSLSGCLGVPKTVEPVTAFQLERYLGTWYEVARLDHSFERGLQRVTAFYSKHPEGGIRVVNRGYAVESGEWEEAEGRAYFVDQDDIGHLKVSFFGPFYASYVIFELDDDYRYAWVTSSDTSYLWFLSRTPDVDADVLDRFIKTAEQKGFAVEDLIMVSH